MKKEKQEMMYAITEGTDSHELRSLSDEEVQAISGSVKTCDAPRPAPTSGPTAGLLLWPLVYKCN
jgi:hypothetical protein